MECACIRHTELPHTSKLFSDYIYDYPRVSSFYAHPPFDPEAYSRAAASLDFPPDRRAALIEALRIQNPESPYLETLARPETVAVVTGQQVGLYSGPCYTLYKALTAVKLARRLSEQGMPAVPIFWLATEDHDFAEVDHCSVFDASHRTVRLQAGGVDPAGRPVGSIPVLQPPNGDLEEVLDTLPFGRDIASVAARCYQPGVTFGDAFRRLLTAILPDHPLLFLDPLLPQVREMAAPTIRAALSRAPALGDALLARSRELERLGYHAQVHVEPGTSLVFLLESGRRIALTRSGNEYAGNSRRFSTEELMDRAANLSPNALLRPVVQDALLPTVAYVGGPAELAYLAQSQVLYEALLGRMPVAVSRAGYTILDHRSRKLMDRYGLTLADFFHGYEALRERAARALTPPSLSERIRETRSAVNAALEQLAGELGAFDPTIQAAFEKSRRKIEYQVAKTERKVARQAFLRDARAASDASYLLGLIYPEKHLQERLYSSLPFLARYGVDLVPRLYENIALDCPDHRILLI